MKRVYNVPTKTTTVLFEWYTICHSVLAELYFPFGLYLVIGPLSAFRQVCLDSLVI